MRNCVITIVWLHLLDFDETLGENAWFELRKNAACCFQQILQATPD